MNITTLNTIGLDGVIIKKGGGGDMPLQDKVVDITENGTTEVLPDSGKALSKVTVNVEVRGEGAENNLYFSFDWGEQTAPIVTLLSSVVRVSQLGLWLPMSAIDNPATISKIDGCAFNLSMEIKNSEMGFTSLVTLEDALKSMVGENYMEAFKQAGFTPITKEEFYSLD